jgi:hypothetical protein
MAYLTQSDDALFVGLYAQGTPFEPAAFFDAEMDQLIYLSTNAPYRADRIDPFLTLLWDADKPNLVGVKIKGFRAVFEQLKTAGLVVEDHFVPLCEIIGKLLHLTVSERTELDQGHYRAKFYRHAEQVVGDYRIEPQKMLAA